MDKWSPLVSVCCITFNHEKFIAEAIEGFLMQKTTFPVEIIIHDDASTDSTASTIREYAAKDNRIIPILRETNLKSTGIPIFPILFKMARGKYIAMCEGDDYWTDPHKLQAQVGYLESHPGCVICAHVTQSINENREPIHRIRPKETEKELFDLDDILKGYFFHTSSVVFKRSALQEDPDFPSRLPPGDWSLFVFLARHGHIGFINRTMSTYRVHMGGVWTSYPVMSRWVDGVRFYQHWYSCLGPQYQARIIDMLLDYLGSAGKELANLGFSQDQALRSEETQAQEWVSRMLDEVHVPVKKEELRKRFWSGFYGTLDLNYRMAGHNFAYSEFADNPLLPILESQALEWLNHRLAVAHGSRHHLRFQKRFLSGFYGALGYQFYQSHELNAARFCFLRAIGTDWAWVTNAGVWSIVGESVLGTPVADQMRRLLHFRRSLT